MIPGDVRVVIVGAGLSGLYAAWLLRRAGLRDFVLLEARDAVGGRVLTVDAAGQPVAHGVSVADPTDLIDRFDLGPTWFWPGDQHELDRLVDDLGLRRFGQHEDGELLLERSPDAPPVRVRGFASAPPSMRLAGGMGALVDALCRGPDPSRIQTGRTVRQLRLARDRVEVLAETADGGTEAWHGEHVLLALPPRLAAGRIGFYPPLPPTLVEGWRGTPTWMAPHAKYLAVYETPFWRPPGLSGGARSVRGPMAEIHDASMPGGHAALFGFIGVPARARAGVTEDVLRGHCRAQLVRLFGPQAATPRAEILKDWAQDPCTSTGDDLDAPVHHTDAPPVAASSGPWQGRLTGIASEWSARFPGYVAGAIEAAGAGVEVLVRGTLPGG